MEGIHPFTARGLDSSLLSDACSCYTYMWVNNSHLKCKKTEELHPKAGVLRWALQKQIREFSLIGVNRSKRSLPVSAAFPARRGQTGLCSNKLKVRCGCLLGNMHFKVFFKCKDPSSRQALTKKKRFHYSLEENWWLSI